MCVKDDSNKNAQEPRNSVGFTQVQGEVLNISKLSIHKHTQNSVRIQEDRICVKTEVR